MEKKKEKYKRTMTDKFHSNEKSIYPLKRRPQASMHTS
jgi:hypothetical protein